MIWIIGEYAERIDNADELLQSFLEGFHDENTQVQYTYSMPHLIEFYVYSTVCFRNNAVHQYILRW